MNCFCIDIACLALLHANRQRYLRLNRHQRLRVGTQDLVVEIGVLGGFDGDDQRVADLLGAGGSTAGFARVVVDVEHRILETAATHVLRAVQDRFPFAHVGAPLFLGRVLLHVEEALGIGVGLAVPDLLVAGTEYDFQAGTRVRSCVLRIGR